MYYWFILCMAWAQRLSLKSLENLLSQNCISSKSFLFCYFTRSEHKDQQRGTYQFRDPRLRGFLASAPLQELAGLSTATSMRSLALPTTRTRWLRLQSSMTTGLNLRWLTIMRGWPLRREWVQCPCSNGWQELHFICTWESTRSGQRKSL